MVASFHDPRVARSLLSTDHTDCVPFDIGLFMIDEDERYAISLESVEVWAWEEGYLWGQRA